MLEVARGWSMDVSRGPDWLFVRLRISSTDWVDAAGLADSVWQLLEQQFSRRLVLELNDLPYLPSSFIGELVRLFKRIQTHDGMMRLCGLSEESLDVLRLTRLDNCFPHYVSREDAVMGARPGRPR